MLTWPSKEAPSGRVTTSAYQKATTSFRLRNVQPTAGIMTTTAKVIPDAG